jgi:hypothetical protein
MLFAIQRRNVDQQCIAKHLQSISRWNESVPIALLEVAGTSQLGWA